MAGPGLLAISCPGHSGHVVNSPGHASIRMIVGIILRQSTHLQVLFSVTAWRCARLALNRCRPLVIYGTLCLPKDDLDRSIDLYDGTRACNNVASKRIIPTKASCKQIHKRLSREENHKSCFHRVAMVEQKGGIQVRDKRPQLSRANSRWKKSLAAPIAIISHPTSPCESLPVVRENPP